MTEKPSIINFGAGPAALPIAVLEEAAKAIIDYDNSGLSILEIPHRGAAFKAILEEAKHLVLSLTKLSSAEYEVLWLQGGGRLQFAMIPMNFLGEEATAGYYDSGFWANDAMQNALPFGKVITLASSKLDNYNSLPVLYEPIPTGLSYVHLTTNNTIYGTQIKEAPKSAAPLIADMSSDIFSEERDYACYDMFYAVAQKNLGIAGVTLVVVKKKMLDKVVRKLPAILDYKQHALHHSVLNTAPVFAVYNALLMLRWTAKQSIELLSRNNETKASLLYAEIERNSLFEPVADTASRSKMNVVFRAINANLDSLFMAFCKENGVVGIEGHRRLGGLRVSLYNATSIMQTQYLIQLMQQFEQKNLNKQ